jgi:hypothetical protein
VEIVTLNNEKKTLLSNGKIIVRTFFLVKITQVPVDETETYLRQNFDKSNNITTEMVTTVF